MVQGSILGYLRGEQIRDWIHVSDHVSGIFSSLAALKGEEIRPGEVINFGGGYEITNLKMVSIILEELGCDESLIEFVLTISFVFCTSSVIDETA